MEVTSLTLGVVSLAGLFNTCIEAFSYLKAARALERDLEILLVKLDIQKARLLSWGNSVGIVRALDDGRSAILEDEPAVQVIKRTLESIHVLLTDSQQLRDRYDMREVPESSNTTTLRYIELVSPTSMTIFRRSYTRLCNRIITNNSRVPASNRVIWAIQDREKFGSLVDDLRDLVDGLVTLLTPVVQSVGNRIIEDDIASLKISNLRLFVEACRGEEEEVYQAWSGVASEAVFASEHGTGDHRIVEEWMEDQSPGVTTPPALNPGNDTVQTHPPPKLAQGAKAFFMFTGQCRNAASSRLPCINPESMQQSLPYFPKESILACHSKSWHPGRRITNYIYLEDVARLEDVTVDQLRVGLVRRQLRGLESAEIPDDSSSDYFDTLSHIATIYMYCPPCSCLIDTAVEVCASMADPQLLCRLIRIDDRLPCSCHDPPLALESLKGIIHNIRQVEQVAPRSQLVRSRAEYIDRDFVENRIWELEEEDMPPLAVSPAENIRRIFANHAYSDDVAGVVVLGEVDSLASLMEVSPFQQVSRLPRANELYVTSPVSWHRPWKRHRIGIFTSYT